MASSTEPAKVAVGWPWPCRNSTAARAWSATLPRIFTTTRRLGPGGRGLGQTDVLANLGNTLQKRITERLLRWLAAGVLPSGSRPDDLFGSTLPSVGPAAPVRVVWLPGGGRP
jgi:hypothetical protein